MRDREGADKMGGRDGKGGAEERQEGELSSPVQRLFARYLVAYPSVVLCHLAAFALVTALLAGPAPV